MSKPYLKQVHTDVMSTNYVDVETGEILDTQQEVKTRKVLVNDEKEFLQIYFSIEGLLDNLSPSESKLLIYLSLRGDEENRIYLPALIREELAEKTGLSVQTVNNNISSLTKKNFLIRIGLGMYRMNPRYVWKKSQGERDKMLKYVLEVECTTC